MADDPAPLPTSSQQQEVVDNERSANEVDPELISFECEICNHVFSKDDLSTVEVHMRIMHNIEPWKPSGNQSKLKASKSTLECQICHRHYTGPATNLSKHLRTAHHVVRRKKKRKMKRVFKLENQEHEEEEMNICQTVTDERIETSFNSESRPYIKTYSSKVRVSSLIRNATNIIETKEMCLESLPSSTTLQKHKLETPTLHTKLDSTNRRTTMSDSTNIFHSKDPGENFKVVHETIQNLVKIEKYETYSEHDMVTQETNQNVSEKISNTYIKIEVDDQETSEYVTGSETGKGVHLAERKTQPIPILPETHFSCELCSDNFSNKSSLIY